MEGEEVNEGKEAHNRMLSGSRVTQATGHVQLYNCSAFLTLVSYKKRKSSAFFPLTYSDLPTRHQ